jgi:hypothetical protein
MGMGTEDMNASITTDSIPLSKLTKSLEMDSLLCSSCKQMHGGARFVEIDGVRFGNYSEEYRIYTEAKWVYYHASNRRTYLEEIEKKRGAIAMSKLRNAMLKIHYTTK